MECHDLYCINITNVQKMHSTLLNSKVSKNIRNQGETLFCWAFASSTMLRQSLNLLLKDVEHEKMIEALAKLNSDDFHRQLRNELIMIPVPKILSPKYNEEAPLSQGHYLRKALERVSCDTGVQSVYYIATMQNRFRELDIFSFSLLDETQIWPRKSILYVQIS